MSTKKIHIEQQKQRGFTLNIKRIVGYFREKFRDIGWYVSNAKRLGSLFRTFENTLGKLNKDAVVILAAWLANIAMTKAVITFASNINQIVHNIIQINDRMNNPDKKDVPNTLIRIFRVIGYVSFTVLGIVSMINQAIPVQNGVMLAFSSLGVVMQVVDILKNIRSQRKDMALHAEMQATIDLTCTEVCELEHKMYKRRWKMATRAASLSLDFIAFALVITAVVTANPMLFTGMLVVGLVGMAMSTILRKVKAHYANKHRESLGLPPCLNKYTLTELIALKAKRLRAGDTVGDDLEKEMIIRRYENIGTRVDVVLGLIGLAISAVAILTANPALFGVVALIGVTLLIVKVVMHVNQQKALAPFEEQQSKMTEDVSVHTKAIELEVVPRQRKSNEGTWRKSLPNIKLGQFFEDDQKWRQAQEPKVHRNASSTPSLK